MGLKQSLSESVTQSCLTLCDPMTEALQAPLFMEFPRWEYLSGLSFPSWSRVLGPVYYKIEAYAKFPKLKKIKNYKLIKSSPTVLAIF